VKKRFAETKNVQRYLVAVNRMLASPPGIDKFMLVHGEVGLGKTETNLWWKNTMSPQSAFIRIKKAMGVRWMLEEIVVELGLVPEHRTSDMFHQIVGELMGTDRALIFDEVDYVADKKTLVETIRDLGDMAGTPIILIGMPWAPEKLKRFPALWRRISQVVPYHGLTAADVRLVMDQICEVTVDDSAVAAIAASTKTVSTASLYRWAQACESVARVRKTDVVTAEHLQKAQAA
jgi:hypothetical protein